MGKSKTGKKKRQGFGRKSTLDMLPEAADEHLAWLNEELRAGKRPQTELLDVFNARLASLDLDIPPISKSAFSRFAVRKAMQFRQLDETRRISVELAEMLGTDSADKMTIAVTEMIKMAAFKLAEGGDLNSKDIMELARATKDAAGAQKTSADYRRQLEREIEERLKKAAADVQSVGKQRGVSQETIDEINRRIMGGA